MNIFEHKKKCSPNTAQCISLTNDVTQTAACFLGSDSWGRHASHGGLGQLPLPNFSLPHTKM